jgi:ABC-type phosphate transport system substrate-binding protein
MDATTKRVAAVLLLLVCLFVLFNGPSSAQSPRDSDDIAVVVHPDTPVNDLTLSEVRQVLLGERQYWTAKLPVVLLIRAPVTHERDVVLRVVYQMTEAQFKQYWVAKIFRAEAASPPKIVYSNDMQYELVSGLPGAIGFMDAHTVRPGLKILRVDGHLPGDKNYPLR